jgi:hypothetical protein
MENCHSSVMMKNYRLTRNIFLLYSARKKNPKRSFLQQKLADEKQSEIDKLLPALFSPF